MARPSNLEAQLTAVTQRFVAEIVEMIRHASVADVAGFDLRRLSSPSPAPSSPSGFSSGYSSSYGGEEPRAPRRGRPPTLQTDAPHSAGGRKAPPPATASSRDDSKRPRQTAERRAELGERVLEALQQATEPLGVRALAAELNIAPDLLSAPLLELRAAGKLTKHGEKRATTYAAIR